MVNSRIKIFIDFLSNRLYIVLILYFLSIFVIELFPILNRILLIFFIVIILFKTNILKIEFKKKVWLQLLFVIPFIYSVLLWCNFKTVILNIIFPIFFFLFNTDLFKKKKTTLIIYKALNFSLVLIFIICLFNIFFDFVEDYFARYSFNIAIDKFKNTYWWNNFVHHAFLKPIQIHPSYLSLFILSAVNWNFNVFYKNLKNEKFEKFNLFQLVFTILFVILVSSKMAYIILIILIAIYLVRIVVIKKFKYFFLITTLGFMCLVLIYNALPSIHNRLTADYNIFKNNSFLIDNKSPVSERIFLWKTSIGILKNKSSGDFCNDIKNVLWINLNKTNKFSLQKKNAHNNFLEFGLIYGWIGIIFLFSIYAILLINVIKNRDYVLGGLILISLCYSLVESTLVREIGVIFMAFLIQYHFINSKKQL